MAQADFWWIVPIASLLAAALGAGAGYFGIIWRYKADYRRETFRDLLTSIQAAADISSEYWLLDPSASLAEKTKCQLFEAKIGGHSERLEAAIDAARPHLRKVDTLGMDIPWSLFLDALTGGEFSDLGRTSNTERAKSVQYASANLLRDLRIAADRQILGI